MCDYSLHSVNNRLAVEGESLLVHRFHTGSKGLASPGAIKTNRAHWMKRLLYHMFFMFWHEIRDAEKSIPAVCVPPGARLYVAGIPKALQREYGVGESEEIAFTQVTAESSCYRDAFRFVSGAEVLIQKFPEGLRVEVLSLALEESETKQIAAVVNTY